MKQFLWARSRRGNLLLGALILLWLNQQPVQAQAPGLVAAYSFDEGTGTTVGDASGNALTGNVSGTTWSSSGKYGSALVFNGTNALVTIPSAAVLQLTTTMTLEAWVNPTAVSAAWRDVIYKGDDNYYLEGTSTQGQAPGMGGTFSPSPLTGTSALAANTWTHLAGTYDGGTMRLYVNGVQVASRAQTGSIATSTNPLQVGGDAIYGQFFQGMIDEVRIYSRALTQAEIQTDMSTPVGNPPPPALSISPGVAALTFTRTQQFTTNNSSVVWLVDGVVGGSASSGTITTSGLYTPPAVAGTHTVTVKTSDLLQSVNAMVYIVNHPGVFTHHYDNLRTGQNLNETVLTPANVTSATFGKLFSYPIDGLALASPLYVPNLNIPGQGFHNVVYVATEHNSVYAFDADGVTSTPLWHVSFIGSGVTTVPCADVGECGDIPTEIGITGTPVIDPATSTLYVVVKTKEGANYPQRLHALDITTGAERFGGPMLIQATVPGTGVGSQNGQLPFLSLRENQRPALLLNNGVIYIAFGSHGDVQPYHGWVLGYNASTLQQVFAFCVTPDNEGAGVWQSGGGLAADASGNVYFATGDGTFTVNTGGIDYGDSYVKLGPTGGVVDYFTPHDQLALDQGNLDLCAGGVLLLPDQPGLHPHLLIGSGKNETVYLIDRDNMGHFNPNNDSHAVQTLPNIFPNGTPEPGNYINPVYFNGTVYFSPVADNIQAFPVNNGLLTTAPTSRSVEAFSYPGGALAISANGTSNAILWTVQRNDVTAPGVLYAYDPADLGHVFYNSSQAGSRDALDPASKFNVPLVVNGRVFVVSMGQLTVFGGISAGTSGPPPPPVLATPANGATGVVTNPTLTWNASAGATSYHLQVSTDAGFGTTVVDQSNITTTSSAVSGLSANTQYFWHVSATNSAGTSAYSTAFAFTTVAPPPPPVLATPANGATGVATNPTLTWNASTGATSYHLQVSTDAGFATTVVDQSNITTTSSAVSGLSANTQYFWHVSATNSAGTSAYSTGWSFTTTAPPPPPTPPVLAIPANGATGVATNPTLTWNASTGATSYRVQVSASSTFATTVVDQSGLTTTSLAISGLAANTQYFWHVNATNGGGTSAFSTAFAFTTAAAPTGLVAAYAFDEGTGTTVNDASGHGLTGTVTSATWTTAGKFNNALVFNGTSALVTIPNAASLQLTTAMTLEAWVNPSVVSSAWRDVIYKGDDNYYLEGTSTQGQAPGMGGTFSPNPLTGTAALAANTWTHLAGTYDGTTMRLYVNGVQVASRAQTGAIATSTNPLQVGGDAIYGQYFQGMIDEVRVYNRALAQTEIQTDMNTPLGAPAQPPPAPVLATPANGATGVATNPTLTWNASTGATSYHLQVSTDAGFGTILADQNNITTTTASVSGLAASTQYFWHVSATNSAGTSAYSTTFAFTTVAPPAPPVLATPANGATGVATNPTLTWNASTGATSYHVQMSTDAGFGTIVADQNNITTTTASVSGLAPSTQYFWHVNATNSAGTSAYSAAFAFTTATPPPPPPPPVLATPANGATGVATNPTLTWNASTGATSYRVQVSTSSGFGTTVVDQSGVTTTSLAIGGLAANTQYFWHVNATNGGGTSAFSTTSSFTTAASLAGLVASYAFNEGTGTTVADASGNGLTGTISGATWTTQGKYGDALSFNGTSSYVDLANPTPLRLTGSMTLCAWVNASANPGDDGQIIAKSNNTGGWQLKTSPDTGPHTFAIAVSTNGNSHTQRYSTTVRALNTWYHVAGVYNGSARTLDIYVNGVLDNGTLSGTVPATQFNSSVNVNIGRRSGGFYFIGTIDEVHVYNRALSQAEIQTDMNTSSASIVRPIIAGIQVRKGDSSIRVTWSGKKQIREATRAATDASEPGEISPDGMTMLKVTAVGAGTIAYQWQKDGLDIPGATGSSYAFAANVTASSRLRCVVTSSFGSDTTGEVLISSDPSSGGSAALNNVDMSTTPGVNTTPLEYALDQNYPNPFNPSTVISYAIPREGHVKLQVFNLLGQPVATLDDQDRVPGYYGTTFDGGKLASGVYVYRIQVGDFVASRKLLLMK